MPVDDESARGEAGRETGKSEEGAQDGEQSSSTLGHKEAERILLESGFTFKICGYERRI